jgi:hypothetical protein
MAGARFIRKFLTTVLGLSVAAAAWAQQVDNAKGNDATDQLQDRITQLEAKVKELQAQQQKPLSNEPVAETVVEVPRQDQPRLKLSVFGDVGFEATDRPNTISNSFNIGSLDLFMTSRLASNLSLLGEVIFLSTKTNHIEADIERLILQYRPSEYFNVGVGRYHTSIGYYNTAFHRGEWFQTPIGRPFMYQFDDTGGPLPLQEVGVSVSGLIPSGKLGMHYIVEVGNGRAHVLGSDPAQNNTDHSNGKSVNFGVFAQPSGLRGLQAGFSIYHNYLIFSDNDNHDELISTAYIVFSDSTYEVLNEAMMVRHSRTEAGTPGIFHTPGFYTQLSRRVASYRPYFRYEYINASSEDPIYGDPADGVVVGRRNGASAGLRWDFNEHAAGKLQYNRMYIRGQGSGNGVAMQFAFVF